MTKTTGDPVDSVNEQPSRAMAVFLLAIGVPSSCPPDMSTEFNPGCEQFIALEIQDLFD